MECGQLGVLLFPILGAGSTFLLSSTKKKNQPRHVSNSLAVRRFPPLTIPWLSMH